MTAPDTVDVRLHLDGPDVLAVDVLGPAPEDLCRVLRLASEHVRQSRSRGRSRKAEQDVTDIRRAVEAAAADGAGGRWPARARTAAVALSGEREDDLDEASLSLLLLADCRAAFARRDADRLLTAQLIEELLADDERPWHEVGRQSKPINAHGISRLLRPYHVKPALMKFSGTTARGYRRADFEPVWARYLPPAAEHPERYSVTESPSEHEISVLNPTPSNGVTRKVPFTEGPVEDEYPASAWDVETPA